jgi:hypothetical protein
LRLRNSDLSNLSRFKSNTLKNLTLWQKEAAFDVSCLEMEGSAADDVEMRIDMNPGASGVRRRYKIA